MTESSILAEMRAGVMKRSDDVITRKASAAAQLTKTAREVPVVHVALPATPAMFPNDQPQDIVIEKIKELTRIIDHLTQARDALVLLAEVQLAGPSDPEAEQKVKERAADKSFAERMETLKAEAQAAAFAQTVAPVYTEEESRPIIEAAQEAAAEPDATPQSILEAAMAAAPDDGWTCPEHGGFVVATSKKGRQYRKCSECAEFERL